MTTTALLDIRIPKKSIEGYPDPTCYKALKEIERRVRVPAVGLRAAHAVEKCGQGLGAAVEGAEADHLADDGDETGDDHGRRYVHLDGGHDERGEDDEEDERGEREGA